jgi:hypothetical protein
MASDDDETVDEPSSGKARTSARKKTAKKASAKKKSPRKKKAAAKKKSPAKKKAPSRKKTAAKKKAAAESVPAPEEAEKPAQEAQEKPVSNQAEAAPGGAPPDGPVTSGELTQRVRTLYPADKHPGSVGYYLSAEWHRNLEARYQAEQGQRFFEGIVETIENATDLHVAERMSLVDRPAFLLKILLHPGRRFRGPVISDGFLQDLGGEARILDIWVSALGPYYYAKGYRLWPSMKEELEGRPPPLDRDDAVARKAMRVAARELKKVGFRRVPGDVARTKVPGIRVPGQVLEEAPSLFDLFFEAVGVTAVPTSHEPYEARDRPDAPPAGKRARPERQVEPEVRSYDPEEPIQDPRLRTDIDLEMEVFQQELEDEIEKIQDEIERAKRKRR